MAHTSSDLSPQESQPKYLLDGSFSSSGSYGRSGRKTDMAFYMIMMVRPSQFRARSVDPVWVIGMIPDGFASLICIV